MCFLLHTERPEVQFSFPGVKRMRFTLMTFLDVLFRLIVSPVRFVSRLVTADVQPIYAQLAKFAAMPAVALGFVNLGMVAAYKSICSEQTQRHKHTLAFDS